MSDPGQAAAVAGPGFRVQGMSTVASRSAHALHLLEFDAALELVAQRASSGIGGDHVRQLIPSDNLDTVRVELARVHSVVLAMQENERFGTGQLADARESLKRLRLGGSVLTALELRQLSDLLESAARVRKVIQDPRTPAQTGAALADLTQRLHANPSLANAISRAISEDGEVLDAASRSLRRIRQELREARDRIVSMLQQMLGSMDDRDRVPDSSVTIRNGRHVIAIRRGAKAGVGGLVHDTSATGATLFVEPPAAVALGNRIRELEVDESREISRILAELTDEARPFEGELAASLAALAELDSLCARARFARDFSCAPCELSQASEGFLLEDARHPLLLAQGVRVVPIAVGLGAGERTLLVSGPNTGGKTVLMKTIALASALMQAGVPAPVATGSRVAVFDSFFADLGDEQSIAASLSTFSAHLRNQSEIIENAGSGSLVLMDEIGSGTDPVEGAALAGAILRELTRRGTTTLATSHLSSLQTLATDVPGIVNGSLQFDVERLAPTYRFIKGVPGRSYGLSIARRYGLREEVVADAERAIPATEKRLATLLSDLERLEASLLARERELRATAEDLATRTGRVHERERDVAAREKDFERSSRRDARRYLLSARADVENVIRELRSTPPADVAEAEHAARSRVEKLVEEHSVVEYAAEGGSPSAISGGPPEVGDEVIISGMNDLRGVLLELRGDQAVVAAGALKLTVAGGSLRRAPSRRPAAPEPVRVRGKLPEERVSPEIDIRGMRVDEIDSPVRAAVDDAARADVRVLRIIHGKGTGALRERVAQLLGGDPRVESFRLGLWNEGGAGVTVVQLR